MIDLQIRRDHLTSRVIRAFLHEHLDNMHAITPPQSVHALDVDKLLAPDISFWSAWFDDELAGCGALREIDARSGEIKSMRTVETHRGRGSRVLEHIITVANQRGYRCLYLETGALPEFAPARSLHARYGFTARGPFPPYGPDPNSAFMEKRLSGGVQ